MYYRILLFSQKINFFYKHCLNSVPGFNNNNKKITKTLVSN